MLIFEAKCSYLRVKPAHLVGHLPNSGRRITESACGDDAGLVFQPAGVHFSTF
jgi:hypothetical protein